MLKEQKGITLVALIITIIVMLILAGVSISLVVGENGVLTQAQNVEPAQIKGALREAISMANADLIATYYGNSAKGFEENFDPAESDDLEYFVNANFSYATEEESASVVVDDETSVATITFDDVTLYADVDDDEDYLQFKDIRETEE